MSSFPVTVLLCLVFHFITAGREVPQRDGLFGSTRKIFEELGQRWVVSGFVFGVVYLTTQITVRSLASPNAKLRSEGYRTQKTRSASQSKIRAIPEQSYEEPCWRVKFSSYLTLQTCLFRAMVFAVFFRPPIVQEKNREKYGELYDVFEIAYSRFLLRRGKDCIARPICSSPGTEVTLKEQASIDRGWTYQFTGETKKCVNFGSYNYLGLASPTGLCSTDAIRAVQEFGVSVGSTRREIGTIALHRELEEQVARFIGVEDSIVCGMGFSCNAGNIPSILYKECLVISDEMNHASIRLGLAIAGNAVRVFKHNDMTSLESVLRKAVINGQPKTHMPWKKIVIIVEGIYSMEGTIVNLPEVVALKKKYKAYLYVDEAHSMGALGPRGRGVCDYFGVDPRDVDIHMATFSKSFASAGGYLAGSKKLIDYLRVNSLAHCYETAMPSSTLQQTLSAMRILNGEYGSDMGKKKIHQLAENTRYFRQTLHKMGLIVYGHNDSPVVPILVVDLKKLRLVTRTLKDMNIATVGVAYPATPLLKPRMRFCLSAEHTRENLDYTLRALGELSKSIGFDDSRLLATR